MGDSRRGGGGGTLGGEGVGDSRRGGGEGVGGSVGLHPHSYKLPQKSESVPRSPIS